MRVYENGAVFKLVNGVECTPTITNTSGYASVRLPGKNHLVHRLVALAFIPNPDSKPQVNHKDGNKRNNNVSNLEWVTAEENMKHAGDVGLIWGNKYGEKSKFTEQGETIVLNIRLLCLRRGITVTCLERNTGLSVGTIRRWKTHTPRQNAIQKVADYFNVPVDYLMSGEATTDA